MAASLIMKPGMLGGPCKRTYQHRDCNEMRSITRSACPYCGSPIGYEKTYIRNPDPRAIGEYVHLACLEDTTEAQQQQRSGVVETN